jgi:methanogenic corrinoid protein MtbC1
MCLVRGLGPDPRRLRVQTLHPGRHAVIARTVENEVIPRLLAACLGEAGLDSAYQPARANAGAAQMPEQVAALTELLLSGAPANAAADFVGHMQGAGIATESLMLNLLTPAAARLGTMWAEDSCDFAEVTTGMLRLANVMRLLSYAFETDTIPTPSSPSALLVQAPGEQHGFGVAMVACFFRRAGWNVTSEPIADRAALLSLVRRNWFNLVGLSVACSDRLEQLEADIRAIRAASRNPEIGIMVGGFAFSEQPHLAESVGADATATDARMAVQQANALVSRLACAR